MMRAPVKSETRRNVTLRAVRRIMNLGPDVGPVIETTPIAAGKFLAPHLARSRWQRRKNGGHHLRRKFFEQSNLPRHVTAPSMHYSQVEQRKMPFRHDLDE